MFSSKRGCGFQHKVKACKIQAVPHAEAVQQWGVGCRGSLVGLSQLSQLCHLRCLSRGGLVSFGSERWDKEVRQKVVLSCRIRHLPLPQWICSLQKTKRTRSTWEALYILFSQNKTFLLRADIFSLYCSFCFSQRLIWMLRFSCSCPRWGYTDKQALQVPEQKLAVHCPFLRAAQPRCRSSSSLRSRAPWRCDGAIVRSPTLAWRYAAHARYPPAGRRARLRVGYVRAAPPTAEGRLTHAQCSSRLRGLLSAPLRAERECRAAHALAGSGFSRPVGSRLALR